MITRKSLVKTITHMVYTIVAVIIIIKKIIIATSGFLKDSSQSSRAEKGLLREMCILLTSANAGCARRQINLPS